MFFSSFGLALDAAVERVAAARRAGADLGHSEADAVTGPFITLR